MRWVIKDSGVPPMLPPRPGGVWHGLRSFMAERKGGTGVGPVPPRVVRRTAKVRAASWLRPGRKAAAGHPAYVPWEALASQVAPDALTAWCEDKVGLRAAILAGIPVIVVPGGVAGAAVLDGVPNLDGIAFARIGRGGEAGEPHAAEAMAGDAAAFTGLVQAALAGVPHRADHLVVTVEGEGLDAPEILAVLQRLADQPGAGPRRVQVVLAGGPGLYIRLAEERLRELREEAQAEVGPGSLAMDPADLDPAPKVGLTGAQRLGAAAGVLVLVALAAGPLVSLGFSGEGKPVAAAVAAMPEAVAAAAVPSPVPVAVPSPAEERARQRREFEASVTASGKDLRKLPAAERERLFREYVAHHPVPKPRPVLQVVDRRS